MAIRFGTVTPITVALAKAAYTAHTIRAAEEYHVLVRGAEDNGSAPGVEEEAGILRRAERPRCLAREVIEARVGGGGSVQRCMEARELFLRGRREQSAEDVIPGRD
ncbi:hypothetical protein H0H81_012637 [Sphagnurus paluster]|uniref:Uncharacterized protein n=1 Tax=Sphagnurus paluster TaxID=117069 RepID=A0A9P7GJ92_9AGAR|nr:hypothetical protein H0H81_012637 [Sphagnurus paluster]